jgi:signal transduction histidine kinase
LPKHDPARPAFERIPRLAANANLEIRTLLREIRPVSDHLDLADLIGRLASRDDWSFAVDVSASVEQQNITNDEVVGLYRIVQEALTNAERYSEANHVTIDVRDRPNVSLSIVDDGCGFEPVAVVGDHMGLTIMGERASEIGADLDISSELGAGTSIQVDLPSSAAV